MNVYVIFGDYSEKITTILSEEFEIAGYERTMESAVIDLQKMQTKPDVLLILGSAMVTGVIEGTINYNAALLENLKQLRLTSPESKIKILILKDTTNDLVKSIISLGIYDIYCVDKISVDELPSIIMTEKNIANYSDDIPVPKMKSLNSNRKIEVLDDEVEDQTPLFKLPTFRLNKSKAQHDIPIKTVIEEEKDIHLGQKNIGTDTGENSFRNGKSVIARQVGNITGMLSNIKIRPENIKIALPKLSKGAKDKEIRYIPHHIITVWCPAGGSIKSLTSLNLAVTAVEQGFDTALINFDLACPILDKWFKIPNTTLDKVKDAWGAGIMTFGPDINPDLAEKMTLDYGWEINYLPAGNKLGNIGTPNISINKLEEIIQNIYRREVNGQPSVTIIDAGSVFELPTTYAALKNASVLLIPISNKQEFKVVCEQLDELERLKIKPKIIEVAWGDFNVRSKNTQVKIPYLADTLYQSSNQRKPYCYLLDENPFEKLLEVATGG